MLLNGLLLAQFPVHLCKIQLFNSDWLAYILDGLYFKAQEIVPKQCLCNKHRLRVCDTSKTYILISSKHFILIIIYLDNYVMLQTHIVSYIFLVKQLTLIPSNVL